MNKFKPIEDIQDLDDEIEKLNQETNEAELEKEQIDLKIYELNQVLTTLENDTEIVKTLERKYNEVNISKEEVEMRKSDLLQQAEKMRQETIKIYDQNETARQELQMISFEISETLGIVNERANRIQMTGERIEALICRLSEQDDPVIPERILKL